MTENEQDPFADIVANTAVLGELVSQIQGEITANEYSSADDDLSTWGDLRLEICSVDTEAEDMTLSDQSDDSSDELEILPPDYSIMIYSDALKAARDLLQFTTERGHEEISEDIHRTLLGLEDIKLKQTHKQTDLLQFFTKYH